MASSTQTARIPPGTGIASAFDPTSSDTTLPSRPPVTDSSARLRSRSNMRNFTEKWPTSVSALTSAGVSTLGTYEPVDFLVADDPNLNGQVMLTCIKELSVPDVSVRQKCAYYLAALNCVFVDLKESCDEAIVQLGGTNVPVYLPSGADTAAIEFVEVADPSLCLLMFGQLILVLFKNISQVSFNPFMKKRIAALRAHIGIVPSATASAAFSFDNANILRASLGPSLKFKKELMMKLIHMTNAESILGNVCTYLCTILAWTDMAPLVFIHNTLLVNNSPVLYDPRVLSEAIHLAHAFNSINLFDFPQYYRILSAAKDQKLLERSRFPTLIAVAQKLRSEQYTTINQFVTPSQADASLVDELVALHKASLRSSNTSSLNTLISSLVDFGDPTA